MAAAGYIGFAAVLVGSTGSVDVGAVFVGAVGIIGIGVAAVGAFRVGARNARWTDRTGTLPLPNLYPRNWRWIGMFYRLLFC